MSSWMVLVPAFMTAFSGVALVLLFLRSAGADAAGRGNANPMDSSSPLLRQEFLSSISFWNRLLERFDFIHIIARRSREAQLNWSVGRVTAMMLLSGAISFVLLKQLAWLPGFAIALGVGFGAFIPYFYVVRRRNRRFARFSEEFPDALDSMCRALKAGHPLSAAVEMLATESPKPVSSEMRKTWDEWNLGAPWEVALGNLAHRVPLQEVSLFAAAVKLHSRTGGKLSQVLGSLAESMREANALQGEIRAVAAHGKMTAGILTVIPALIAFMMNMINPAHLDVLYNHPYGKDMIAAAVACIIAAHFVMRKILDIRP